METCDKVPETTMKPSLQPGLSTVKRIAIDRDRTISFMGEDARVYATPRLISDVEFTCRDFLLQHADAGEDSVGMEVALKHLAPTLAGSTVEITARITAVEGRKVTFEVSAKDELDTVSAGTHTRFVVDVGKTKERLKAKAAKLAALPR
jgi:predicted thioesterase